MGFFLLFALAVLKKLNLRDSREMNALAPNCAANYALPAISGELVTLVAIFRHGDRAPLAIKGREWTAKSCIVCNGTCKSKTCTEGMLTKKGYVQSKKLGAFIRKRYQPIFRELKTIVGYHSSYERSISTLHGVLAGLNEDASQVKQENTIVSASNSKILKNIIMNYQVGGLKKKSPDDYKVFDEIISHYCSDTPYDCSMFNCNAQKILSFVDKQQEDFVEYTNLIRSNIMSMGITLGDFGMFLKKEMMRRNTISLISGHDSLIIKVLAGLNAVVTKFPPYSSAIFVEVWRLPGRAEEFVRVVYDGQIQEVGLYKEKYISFTNFIKYLDMYNNANSKIGDVISGDKLVNDNDIMNAMKYVNEAYDPIIKAVSRHGINPGLVIPQGSKLLPPYDASGDDVYSATMQFLYEDVWKPSTLPLSAIIS